MKNLLRPILAMTVVAGLAAAPAFADDLILNGSFESGDYTSWTVSNNANATFVAGSGFDGYASEDGSYFAALGNVSSVATISQTFSDVAGATYALSYYYASNGTGGATGYFSAGIDNATFAGSVQDGFANSADVYSLYTYDFVGTGSDTVVFSEENDPAYNALDNVSVSTVAAVSATPEPSSLVLLGSGILSVAGAARRKFRKA